LTALPPPSATIIVPASSSDVIADFPCQAGPLLGTTDSVPVAEFLALSATPAPGLRLAVPTSGQSWLPLGIQAARLEACVTRALLPRFTPLRSAGAPVAPLARPGEPCSGWIKARPPVGSRPFGPRPAAPQLAACGLTAVRGSGQMSACAFTYLGWGGGID
jgi:hypothetical protein